MAKFADLSRRAKKGEGGPHPLFNKPCTLCGGSKVMAEDLGACIACDGTGVAVKRSNIIRPRAKPTTPPGEMSLGPPKAKPGEAPWLPVRPTDKEGKPVEDTVFMALQDLGWCQFAPFDDPQHSQPKLPYLTARRKDLPRSDTVDGPTARALLGDPSVKRQGAYSGEKV